MNLGKRQKDQIVKFFERRPEIAAVYLYGSQVKGFARGDSDIDLAALVADRKTFGGFDIHQTRYTYDLSKLLGKEVEVQDLEKAPIDFAHRVISEGEILSGLDSKIRVDFEEKILREFFDMKPSIDEYFRYLREMARKGELGVGYI